MNEHKNIFSWWFNIKTPWAIIKIPIAILLIFNTLASWFCCFFGYCICGVASVMVESLIKNNDLNKHDYWVVRW